MINKKEKESDKINSLRYSTCYINIVSLIITIIISFFINNLPTNFLSHKAVFKAEFSANSNKAENSNNLENSENLYNFENQQKTEQINSNLNSIQNNEIWYLEIPNINLKANIKEGTEKETMNKFIGHFETSKKWAGNVCLAAHNRGYENNYFSEVKQLKKGDKIIYYYQNNSREYSVEKNDIILATDFSCLENTEDNTITLITCVENEPNYRRCVKAIEIK